MFDGYHSQYSVACPEIKAIGYNIFRLIKLRTPSPIEYREGFFLKIFSLFLSKNITALIATYFKLDLARFWWTTWAI
jgi:hypothetical protein